MAGPCPYLPKPSALLRPPSRNHRCCACFFPFSVTAPLLPSAACQTLHSWREPQTGRTGGACWSDLSLQAAKQPRGLLDREGPARSPRAQHGACPPAGPLTLQHAPVGRVSDGVDVGRHLVPLLALVHVDDFLRVDGQLLVGVDYHAEEARVCLQNREPKLTPRTWQGGELGCPACRVRARQHPSCLHLLSATVYIFSL